MSAETTTMDVTTAQRMAEGLIARHRHPCADDRIAAAVLAGIVLAAVLGLAAYLIWVW